MHVAVIPGILKPVAVALLAAGASLALAQPRFESASPTAGGTTSQQANQTAGKTVYQAVDYTNKNKAGPQVSVIGCGCGRTACTRMNGRRSMTGPVSSCRRTGVATKRLLHARATAAATSSWHWTSPARWTARLRSSLAFMRRST